MAGGGVNNDQEVELGSATLSGFQQQMGFLPQAAIIFASLLQRHLVRHTVQAAMLEV